MLADSRAADDEEPFPPLEFRRNSFGERGAE